MLLLTLAHDVSIDVITCTDALCPLDAQVRCMHSSQPSSSPYVGAWARGDCLDSHICPVLAGTCP